MPIKRRIHKRREPVPGWIYAYFERGVCTAEDELAELNLDPKYWPRVSGELVESFIEAHPGKRPWAWWAYDAPALEIDEGAELEPFEVMRRQVGGSGALIGGPELHFGIPGWIDYFNPPLPPDPPRYESQASYLKRHGLLSATEKRRLRKKDFAPETIELGYDEPFEPLDDLLERMKHQHQQLTGGKIT